MSELYIRELLSMALEPGGSSAAEFARVLEDIPADISGIYTCGCPWVGRVVPHFCPVHPGACVVFEIREPRS